MKWLPALVGLIAVSSCADRTTLDDADQSNAPFALQALLDEGVTQGIPGLSAAVATRDSVVWTGVAGLADIRGGVPVTSDMLFGIGSITKTFVAVVILQLAEEGRLDLDATSASVLGPAVSGVPNADKATIAQLLNHTGGVPSWEDDPSWIRDGRGTTLDVSRIWGKTETLPYIAGHEPLAEPGAEYSYANTNFTLLGMIIEKVTGQEAVDEIHRRVLEPLGSGRHPSGRLRARAGATASASLPLGYSHVSGRSGRERDVLRRAPRSDRRERLKPVGGVDGRRHGVDGPGSGALRCRTA